MKKPLRARPFSTWPKRHFKASLVTGTAVDVTGSQRAPEDAIIHSDTESALQATSVRAGVKHTASSGGEAGHQEVWPTADQKGHRRVWIMHKYTQQHCKVKARCHGESRMFRFSLKSCSCYTTSWNGLKVFRSCCWESVQQNRQIPSHTANQTSFTLYKSPQYTEQKVTESSAAIFKRSFNEETEQTSRDEATLLEVKWALKSETSAAGKWHKHMNAAGILIHTHQI